MARWIALGIALAVLWLLSLAIVYLATTLRWNGFMRDGWNRLTLVSARREITVIDVVDVFGADHAPAQWAHRPAVLR